MAKKAKNAKNAKRARPVRRRSDRARPRKEPRADGVFLNALRRNIVPLTISAAVVLCLGAVAALAYGSVAESRFFALKTVRVLGTSRSSAADIENIVKANVEKSGVWNADLLEIKQKIEKAAFVKNASVSRNLPTGIIVNVDERIPVALVQLGSGKYLADAEGVILARASADEKQFAFAMQGWDETKSEKADKENIERLKIYQKMCADWADYDLVSRVKGVDLSDTRQPKATLEDSGLPITIALGRDNFGQQLSSGIKAIVGKGNMFEGVELVGANMRLIPRKEQQ